MTVEFSEINSFSTVVRFALALETNIVNLTEEAMNNDACAASKDLLAACNKFHQKRLKQLERMRREQLNEMVLQPVEGMDYTSYIPPTELPADDVAKILETIVAAEEATAHFYEDAAIIAAEVLTSLVRSFNKLAKKGRDFSAKLTA